MSTILTDVSAACLLNIYISGTEGTSLGLVQSSHEL
jgi:hypothetical protein